MNPQQNDTQQGNTENPQAQGQSVPNFDGFGGPNIAYENYDDNAIQQQQQAQQQASNAIPMNVVDVVNANGVVSGRKVVDYTWQRGAILLGVLAAGLLVGLIVALMIVVNNDKEIAKTKRELETTKGELNSIYAKIGVDDLSGAISRISSTEILNGGDLEEINTLLTGKYNASYKLDLADSNINFVTRNGVYKVVSLGIHRESGTQRAVLYEKIADGKWKLGGFDASKKDPCADSTDEEKEAIKEVIPCAAEEDKE
ncbi:MAG: hypothetical protein K6F57_04305 [Candidatus Saccharibacteria bacterium]|nr:hypothetical protein [Candidatus Saccharibacteria bacterium]